MENQLCPGFSNPSLRKGHLKNILSVEVAMLYNITIDILLKAYTCDNKKCTLQILDKHSAFL